MTENANIGNPGPPAPSQRQQQFVPMFIFILGADFLVSLALASKNDVWAHLAMLWSGPLDDIFYLVAGARAFLFLLDPWGKTQKEDGSQCWAGTWKLISGGNGVFERLAAGLILGARKCLKVLPLLVLGCLVACGLMESLPLIALKATLYRHLSLVFPVFLFLGLGFSVLGLAPSPGDFWKTSALGWVGLLAVAAVDGRWNNHLYHLFSHLESPQAWAAAVTWAAFFVVEQHGTTEHGIEAQTA